jgi:hypothetical protein
MEWVKIDKGGKNEVVGNREVVKRREMEMNEEKENKTLMWIIDTVLSVT